MRWIALFLLAVSAHAADRYLFVSFRNNGEDGVHYALSSDGFHWTALDSDRPFFRPTLEGEMTRDPFLTRGPDGVYHMIWTWGWNQDAAGLRLGHATSRDLIHWTEEPFIPVLANEPTARNAWAPEMSWDATNRNWLIYWATTIPGRYPATDNDGDNQLNHRIYCMTTRDFREYTTARVLFDPGFSVIDATILRAGGRWVMIFKDERRNPLKKNLRLAFANELAGPYTGITEPFTDSWNEGPTAIPIGKDYIVYFDHYQRPQHYGAMRSRDLMHWEDITSQMAFPAGQRHGTVIRISEKEAAALGKGPELDSPHGALGVVRREPERR